MAIVRTLRYTVIEYDEKIASVPLSHTRATNVNEEELRKQFPVFAAILAKHYGGDLQNAWHLRVRVRGMPIWLSFGLWQYPVDVITSGNDVIGEVAR